MCLRHPDSKGVFRLRVELFVFARQQASSLSAKDILFSLVAGFCVFARSDVAATGALVLLVDSQASANSLWQGGRRRVHSNSLHLGRDVPVYAFCGTSAAKVNLINCKNVFPSGEKGFWPEEKHLNDVSSTERRVWPDGNAVGVYRSQQNTPLGRGNISRCICRFAEGPASLSHNPKNTFEHLPHSTAFY